jgi:hypothetical protein
MSNYAKLNCWGKKISRGNCETIKTPKNLEAYHERACAEATKENLRAEVNQYNNTRTVSERF